MDDEIDQLKQTYVDGFHDLVWLLYILIGLLVVLSILYVVSKLLASIPIRPAKPFDPENERKDPDSADATSVNEE